MALRYDFDMVAVNPQGLPDAFGDLALTGVNAEQVAMFRDQDTVDALMRADTTVRTFFTESGFALTSFDSGAPPNWYLQRDEAARVTVIDRLSENLARHKLDNADWGGFEFPAFMQSLSSAKALEDDALVDPPVRARQSDPAFIEAQQASRKMRNRRMIALTGMIAGLILLVFVATQLLA